MEERPCPFVCPHLPVVSRGESDMLLFERIPLGSPLISSIECLNSGLRHQPPTLKLLCPPDVYCAPDAISLAGRESNHVSVSVNRFADTVDPSEAERLVDRLWPGDTLCSRMRLEVSHPQLAGSSMMFLQPLPKGGLRWEEFPFD